MYNESDRLAVTELMTTSMFEVDVSVVGIPGKISGDGHGLEIIEMLVRNNIGGLTNIPVVNFNGQQYGVGEVNRKFAHF